MRRLHHGDGTEYPNSIVGIGAKTQQFGQKSMVKNASYKWIVLSALFILVTATFGSMNVVAPLVAIIDDDMGMTLSQVGATVSFFLLASPIFSPLAGILVDRFGPRWILFVAALVVAIAGAVRGLATSPNQIIILMFIGGLGFACVGPAIPKALSSVFTAQKFGVANGIVFSGFWVGSTLAFALSADVLVPLSGGWREAMFVLGGICIICAILWLAIFQELKPTTGGDHANNAPPPESESSSQSDKSFTQLIKLPELWLVSLFFFCCVAALFSILGFMPRILEERGFENSGVLASLFTASMVVFNILGGYLSDRFGRRETLALSSWILGIMIPGFLVLEGPALVACLLIAGGAAGPITPVTTAIPVELERIGPAAAGTALGILFMIGNLGGFFAPMITGALMDYTTEAWIGFAPIFCLLMFGPILLWRLPAESRGKT